MFAWRRKTASCGNQAAVIYRVIARLSLLITLFFIVSALAGCQGHMIGMLNPKGVITFEQRKLFFDTLALMLIVVLPVIIMSITFVYHYQVSHQIKDYKPNWGHDYFLESLWWGIPCVIVVILAVLTWKKTYELDPFRRIPGHDQQPMLIQVIALPWKWLFIYPEQNIALVNYLVIPVGQQVEFWITTDNVPMSAFFIPQIGSQIYAMAGMRTRLHLVANEIGVYDGLNTQYNGDGFSDMHFPVYVVEPEKMQVWFDGVRTSNKPLTDADYKELLKPKMGGPAKFFSGVEKDLFQNVINIYMNSFGTVHPRSTEAPYIQPNNLEEA